MLCGSNSTKMTKLRLDRLSTFGLLGHLKQTEVATLIEGLLAAGCLEQTDLDRFRPVVRLTALGGDVMRRQASIPANLPIAVDLLRKLSRRKPGKRPEVAETPAEPPAGPVRKAVAEPREVPSPMESPPAVRQSPTMPASEIRAAEMDESYGEEEPYLPAWDTMEPSARPAAAAPPKSPASPQRPDGRQIAATERPPHYWTCELFESGYSLEECMAIRGLTHEKILDHLLQAAESGAAVQPQWCLKPELITAIRQLIGDTTPDRIRPLLSQLPTGTRYEEVQLFLKCRL